MSKIFKLVGILLLIPLLALSLVGCAKEELTLTVYTPVDGDMRTSSSVTLQGKVSDSGATVKINDTEVPVTKFGAFSAKVTLNEGENTIKVVATWGEEVVTKTITKTITVTYTPSQ